MRVSPAPCPRRPRCTEMCLVSTGSSARVRRQRRRRIACSLRAGHLSDCGRFAAGARPRPCTRHPGGPSRCIERRLVCATSAAGARRRIPSRPPAEPALGLPSRRQGLRASFRRPFRTAQSWTPRADEGAATFSPPIRAPVRNEAGMSAPSSETRRRAVDDALDHLRMTADCTELSSVQGWRRALTLRRAPCDKIAVAAAALRIVYRLVGIAHHVP